MSQKRYLQIKNFDDQLHYKDKNPIWIKLHCSLLDDYEFANIPDETKFHAVGLMILAARLNNKLPDDEAWLRQKINANGEINLNLLLEIGFLEPLKGARSGAKNPFNACKSKKTKANMSRPLFKTALAQNRTEQNRTKQNKTDENTTQQNTTDETREPPAPDAAENGVVVCVDFKTSKTGEENHETEISGETAVEAESTDRAENNGAAENAMSAGKTGSLFSLEDCLRYVHLRETRGDPIKNPQGLAHHLHKTGASDVFIRAALFPEQQAAAEREQFGAPVKFLDESCRVCFGAKMADADGKGFRACEHCKDERGKSTGREPGG